MMCLLCFCCCGGDDDEARRPVRRWQSMTRQAVSLGCIAWSEEMRRPCCPCTQRKLALGLCKTITNLLASALTVYIFSLIFFRPYAVRPSLDAAVLAAFDLAPNDNTTLVYDLALNVTFFNDHRVYSIRFDHLTAGLYYNGTNKIGQDGDTPLFPSGFTQRPRRHRTVRPVLRGTASNVSAAVAEEFAREKALGSFAVDVVIRTTLTYKFWPARAVYYYQYNCWLLLPDPARRDNDGTLPVVRGGKCGVAK